ncbi:MAG: hypothetical protein QGH20_09910 [Candidatus Latescibacteria bacterium]|nr:hypothetical protein [Candidatus Latescibacterota bacterium]
MANRCHHSPATDIPVAHAAGVAGALAALSERSLRQMAVGEIRDELVRQGAVVN